MIAHAIPSARAMRRGFIALAVPAVLTLSACASTVGIGSQTANRLASYQVDAPPHGHGTGVVLANVNDGAFILTCSHVVHGEKNISVAVIDENGAPAACKATIVVDDPDKDLAVLRVGCRFPSTVVLDRADTVMTGDDIYNVGYPYDFGEMFGKGYVQKLRFSGMVLTQTGPVFVKDSYLVHVPDGAGTSGSGIFLMRNGLLVGIMQSGYGKGEPPVQVNVRIIIPMSRIRPFLDKHGIPYTTIAE